MQKKALLLALSAAIIGNAQAQLSSNPDKFLGNITTSYNVDFGSEKYYTLWNQITCENESKWGSIEGTNNTFNWGGSDNAYNYAKSHNFPFKFHALVWGAQYPSWLESQTPQQRYKEIVQWMDAVKAHYPNLQLIDVVNEAVTGHQAGTPYFIEALGGTGVTGYDWLIKAFELAYERWPDAILIYNDFNTFQWNTDQYIDLVKTLRNAGAPIDAYGCQSHDLTDCSFSTFQSSMTKLQDALKMPMYSTEYDIGTSDDALQLQRYKEQIPYMWEKDYVAGVTLWGYIYGRTWTTDGNSGLIKDGEDRPAMTWLREYMQSDAAKKAKSPFPGMKKEASVYIKPSSINIEKGVPANILVRARMRTKTIEKVDLYAANKLIATMTEAPYQVDYTATEFGNVELKAVVTTTDGSTYTRYSTVTVCNARAPFKGTPATLPGVVEAENFDEGPDGVAFHDNNSSKQGTGASYRSDITGIDVEKGGTGYCVGYAEVGEWMEYTVDVKEAGTYAFEISYSSPEAGTAINLALSTADGLTLLTPEKLVLAKSTDWNSFRTGHGRLKLPLSEGRQVIRLSIVGGASTYVANIDKITFKRIELSEGTTVSLSPDNKKPSAGARLKFTADVQTSAAISNVKFYQDGVLCTTDTSAPYEYSFTPSQKGTYRITAIATDTDGRQSNEAVYNISVSAARSPYKTLVAPGVVEAEYFDKGEEGLTFHDSDTKDEGGTKFRSDNGGVDIVAGNGGYVIGYTANGEWLEYTVNFKESGKYTCTSTVSSGTSGSSFSICEVVNGSVTTLWRVTIPQTGSNSWDTYKAVNSNTQKTFEAGTHVIRIVVGGANGNIDKFEFKLVESTAIEEVEEQAPETAYRIYNMSGSCVGQVVATDRADLMRKIADLTGSKGMFVAESISTRSAVKVMIR